MMVLAQDLNQIVYTPSQVPSSAAFKGVMPDPALYARNLRRLVGQKRAYQRMYNAFLPRAIAGAVQDLSIPCIDWQYMPGWTEPLLPFLQTLPCFTQLHLFYTANAFCNRCCDSVAGQAALLPNLGSRLDMPLSSMTFYTSIPSPWNRTISGVRLPIPRSNCPFICICNMQKTAL